MSYSLRHLWTIQLYVNEKMYENMYEAFFESLYIFMFILQKKKVDVLGNWFYNKQTDHPYFGIIYHSVQLLK